MLGIAAALVLVLGLLVAGYTWHRRHHGMTAVRPQVDLSSLAPAPDNIINGRQITADNTGVGAWRGPGGQRCTNPRIYTGKVHTSDLGRSVGCAWFKADVVVDSPIIFTASRFDRAVDVNGHLVRFDYDTIDTTQVEDIALFGGPFVLNRSIVAGSTDAVRFENDLVVESYLRTKAHLNADPPDHNDGIQAYRSAYGGSILRSNIDGHPTNTGATNYGDAAILFADGSLGDVDIEQNYLAGGAITLRLNEASIYRHVTGNVIAKGSYLYNPVDTTNAAPGAFPDWAENTLSDGTPLPTP